MSNKALKELENNWKELTKASNEFFNAKEYKDALQGYKEALGRAEIINEYHQKAINLGIPFIQIYIISCNNFAFTCQELKQATTGEIVLKRTIYFLLHLLENEKMDMTELHHELKQAMITYSEYIMNCNLDIELQQEVFTDIQQSVKTEDMFRFLSF
jgi:hypothetical protein